MRGMSMREMKARQMGKTARTTPEPRKPPESEHEDDIEDELDEPMEGELFVDQGDGVVVSTSGRRRTSEFEVSFDCPDEPPEGWGEG